MDPFASIRDWSSKRSAKGWWHSFKLPDGSFIDGVCSLASLEERIAQFPIPNDLHGKRVLDIGTWDGWFAFEMERRGAEVLAIDCWDNPRFHEIHARLGSRVEYRQIDIYKLTPELVGRFDIVLFMGVLYHLKHPLLALERVCALTTEMAAVDSFVLRETHRPGENIETRPVMEFYETAEMGGQTDNWVGPSLPCLMAFCRTAGFARVEFRSLVEHSACVACFRRWEPPSHHAQTAPELLEACNNGDQGINFDSSADEYVSVWFDTDLRELTLDEVRPQVGDYGVRPLHIGKIGERTWHSNFKLPPGLAPGWHGVTIRLADSGPSNAKAIAVDLPICAGEIEIVGLYDGSTWIKNELDRTRGSAIALWVAGLPGNADCNNVRVFLGGRRLAISYIDRRIENQPKQVNVDVPSDVGSGTMEIEVAVGDARIRADLIVR
jgi:tRNA (mo5U34)-methyltransferase